MDTNFITDSDSGYVGLEFVDDRAACHDFCSEFSAITFYVLEMVSGVTYCFCYPGMYNPATVTV
jgi:hypothetical protein